MLGFGNKVGKINNIEQAKKFTEFMETNKSIFKNWSIIDIVHNPSPDLINLVNCYEFNYTFISDSIVLSFIPKESKTYYTEMEYYNHSANVFYLMVNRVNSILFNMLYEHKILLRGGISKKFSYIKNEFVVGEGLIESYLLESKKAIYPRIILSKEFTDDSKFMSALKFTSNKMYNNSRLIKKDKDGYFFIDYLGYMIAQQESNKLRDKVGNKHYGEMKIKLAKDKMDITNKRFFKVHKASIEDMYKFLESKRGTKQSSYIEEKYNWIKSYHNNHMKNKLSEFKIKEEAQ
jgi:hypothetical protein